MRNIMQQLVNSKKLLKLEVNSYYFFTLIISIISDYLFFNILLNLYLEAKIVSFCLARFFGFHVFLYLLNKKIPLNKYKLMTFYSVFIINILMSIVLDGFMRSIENHFIYKFSLDFILFIFNYILLKKIWENNN